jgi:hypothetical protein
MVDLRLSDFHANLVVGARPGNWGFTFPLNPVVGSSTVIDCEKSKTGSIFDLASYGVIKFS